MSNSWFVRRPGLFVFSIALLVRLIVCAWAADRVPPTADGAYYHIVAQRIAEGLGYTWAWPDGAVTYAAHYPVGYPAMMAPIYKLFGPVVGLVMLQNALWGAFAAMALFHVCRATVEETRLHRFALPGAYAVALGVALSPSLVLYTPALMTEGAVGAFVVFAAYFCIRARKGERRALWLVAMILCLVVATYLRPQTILMAPVLGFLSISRPLLRRVTSAAVVLGATLLFVLPWTLRNCDRMERCVFVSANGGWNFLIGTFEEGRGAWVPLDGERVPMNCREVFAEAAKDECFGAAARERIVADPLAWVRLAPDKWRATFDHTAVAAEHLDAAGALSGPWKKRVMILEYLGQRLAFLATVLGAFALAGPMSVGERERSWMRWGRVTLLSLGWVGFAGLGASYGWFAVVALCGLGGRASLEIGVGLAASSVVLTALLHAAFFGAGRYSLPLLLWTGPLTALGAAYLCEKASSYKARAVIESALDFDRQPGARR